MEIVYMGLISKIFNAIFNAILSPVFKFISSLLETVLSWLFDTVLKPLLLNVLQPLFTALLELIIDILSGIIYSLYADCLQLVDSLQTAFDIFAGLKPVTYQGKSSSLLQTVFELDQVKTAVWTLIGVGFVLMMLFAILGTVRSMGDLDEETQRPVSKVLSGVFKGMAKMFLIPTVCLFAIMMSTQILGGIDTAFGGSQTSMARMVFVVSSLDASKKQEYNVSAQSGNSSGDWNIGINDPVRKPYYTGAYSYTDKSRVEKDFDLGEFDYLIGFGGSVFLVIVLAICLLTFITRIFEVVILFVVSPLFASVMPLDDGEKFKAWQDMFVAKLFGGYGTVMAMQIYMQLCPSVMDGNIIFGEGSAEANYLIRLVFLLGGAWAVIKAGPTITQLLNFQAGAAESESGRVVSAGLIGAASFAGSAAGAAYGKVSQSYNGWKSNKNEAFRESGKRISNRLGWETDASGSRTGRKLSEAGAQRGSGGGVNTGGGRNTIGNGRNQVHKGEGRSQRTASYFNGRITANKSKGGHSYLGVDFGKKLQFGRNADGTFSARFMGVGWRTGQDGKLDKVALPFVRMKRSAEGKMQVARYKIPMSGLQYRRTENVTLRSDGSSERTLGSFYVSDNIWSRSKRRFDQDTGKVETLKRGGNYYEKDAEGQYVKTHHEGIFGIRTEYEKDGDKYRKANRVGNFTESSYSYNEKGKRQTNSISSIKSHQRAADGSRPGSGKYIFKRDTVGERDQS